MRRTPRRNSRSGGSKDGAHGTSGGSRCDRVVADHAPDFFHQILRRRNVFRCAPRRHGNRKCIRPALLHPKLQRFENPPHFRLTQAPGPASAPANRDRAPPEPARAADPDRSARPPTNRAPGETIGIISIARASARTVLCGSCAFSKRIEASVRSLSAAEVLRTLPAWKFAASNTIDVVVSEIALSRPPITPANPDRSRRIRDHQIRRRELILAHDSTRRCVRPLAPDAPRSCPHAALRDRTHASAAPAPP